VATTHNKRQQMGMILSELFSQTTRIVSYNGTTWIENDPISRVYKYVFMYYTGKYVVVPGMRYIYSYGLRYFYNKDPASEPDFDDVKENNAQTQTPNAKSYFG
jgi:hypothetical protein